MRVAQPGRVGMRLTSEIQAEKVRSAFSNIIFDMLSQHWNATNA
jgi:hypothetical protein